MKRNKKIVIIAHCLLNCNSKVEGLALYDGALREVITYIINQGYGIIQLPCPELTLYGIKRWGHVKEQFDTPYYRSHCRKILQPYIEQIKDYLKNGYEIKTAIGIDGSPSCGVNKTCFSKAWGGTLANPDLKKNKDTVLMEEGRGVFFEELEKLLRENLLEIPFSAIDEVNIEESLMMIKNALS